VVADILGDRAEAVAASIRASNGAAIAAAIDVTSEPAWVARFLASSNAGSLEASRVAADVSIGARLACCVDAA